MNLREFVLWEDETLLAINKPAGLLTIRDGYNSSLPYLAQMLEAEFGRVWVVHRLDKGTSGVILFARDSEAHSDLNRQFSERDWSPACPNGKQPLYPCRCGSTATAGIVR
jgi:tRNA pseudouridine32 synthase/23S rRNA pseudouridine746 synthase